MDVVRSSVQRIDDPTDRFTESLGDGHLTGALFTKKAVLGELPVDDVVDRLLRSQIRIGDQILGEFFTRRKTSPPVQELLSPGSGSHFAGDQ